MNMHRATLVPINAGPSERTLLGRDQHELIEAAVEHYRQHLDRMFHELKAEARWHDRRMRTYCSSTYTESASFLGNKVAILRALSDQIAAAHELHIIPQED